MTSKDRNQIPPGDLHQLPAGGVPRASSRHLRRIETSTRRCFRQDYRFVQASCIGLAALLALGEGCATDPAGEPVSVEKRDVVGTPIRICGPTTDIVVSDVETFGANNGGLIRIDPTTGGRATLSENNSPVGGPDFETPEALEFEADGNIVLVDAFEAIGPRNPGVVRVNPVTGVRRVLSNNTTPAVPAGAPMFSQPTGIAVAANGMILVADMGTAPLRNGAVILVDPTTGARATLSQNGAPAGGPNFDFPWELTVAANGDIYVVDPGNFVSSGKIIRVDPVTGARTLVSKNTSPPGGPDFVFPWGITVDKVGNILVSDQGAFGGTGGIIRVDPVTGVRTTVSENTAPAGGPSFSSPGDLVVEDCGSILVTDHSAVAVFRVDATTGVRTVVSDNATPVGLPNFVYNLGIAIRHSLGIPVHGPFGGGGL